MKRPLVVAFAFALGGCVAHMTPYGLSIEPVPDVYVVGPPVVVDPPRAYVAPALPPVVVVPERSVYFYNDLYYYFWGDVWFWGRGWSGPWHRLPRDRWPPRVERRERGPRGAPMPPARR